MTVFLVLLTMFVSLMGLFYLMKMASSIEKRINQVHLAHLNNIEKLKLESQKKSLLLKDLEIENITHAVDLSTHSVEKIHQTIAETSFNIMRSVKPAHKPTDAIQKAHDLTSKEVYSSIRKVNKIVGQFSRHLSEDKKGHQDRND